MSDVLHHAPHYDDKESFSARQRRIGCELLLARLCRFHPDEARQIIKGIKSTAPDDDDPPLTKIIVKRYELKLSVPEGPAEPVVVPLPVPVASTDEPMPTIKMIIREVAKFYKLPAHDLKSECRQAFLVRPRQVAMFLCREMTRNSFPQIAKQFGDRDHTTALYAWAKISAMVGEFRGESVETHSKLKYSEAFQFDERLKDEIDVLKLHVRQALFNNPGASDAASLSISQN